MKMHKLELLFVNIIMVISTRVALIKSTESIEVQTPSSLRNNRQLYQVYSSTKYTIPKRQTIISAGQIFTPDDFPNYHQQYSNNQQQTYARPARVNPVTVPHAARPLTQSQKPIHNAGGTFVFPDALEAKYTIQQTKQQHRPQQPESSQHQEQQYFNGRQNFDKAPGSKCRRSFDQKNGQCQFAHQCLHIVREFRVNGVKLDICSYEGNVPVICCPPENKIDPAELVDLNRISAKKCAEYNNFGVDMLKPSKRANHSVKKCEPSVPLIVGGEETVPGEYPHMAAIGWIKERGHISWACGGTLISEFFVLTAAHCTTLGGNAPDLVKLGAQDVNSQKRESNSISFRITEIISHPKYNKEEYYYDIALIKLNKVVKFTKYIKPACLWFRSKMDDIEIVTATGWGRTRYLGPKSESLLKVDLEIVSNEKCNELYKREVKLNLGITEDQFCAGYLEGGKDTCQGDSGGPINVQTGKYNCVNYVIGITSFGKFCAAPNSPGVYTKINSYLDWIENIAFK